MDVAIDVENVGITTPSKECKKEKRLDLRNIRERLEGECKLNHSLTYRPSDFDLNFRIHNHGGFQILGRPDLSKIWGDEYLNIDSIDESQKEMKKNFLNYIREEFENMLIDLARKNIDSARNETTYDDVSDQLKVGTLSPELKNLLDRLSLLNGNGENSEKLTELEWHTDAYKLKDQNGMIKALIFDLGWKVDIFYLGNFMYDDSFEIGFLKCVHKFEREINIESGHILDVLRYFGVVNEKKNGITFSPERHNMNLSIELEEGKTRIGFNANDFDNLLDGIEWIEKVGEILEAKEWIEDAQNYAQEGEITKAKKVIQNIEEVLEEYEHPRVAYAKGIISFHDEEYQRAINLFEKADDNSEEFFIEPLNEKAKVHIHLGEYQEAKEDLKKSLRIYPSQPKTEKELEKVELRIKIENELESASESQGIEGRVKKFIDKQYEKAKEYFEKGKIERTRELSKKIEDKSSDENPPEAFCLKGLVCLEDGDYKKAIKCFERANSYSNPLFLDPLIKMSEAHIKNDNYDKATETIEKAKNILKIAKEVKRKTGIKSDRDIDSRLEEIEEKLDQISEKRIYS